MYYHQGKVFKKMIRQLPRTLQTHVYDVLIIGGGCNGTGVARDLALRGASVLLLDESDPNKATHHNSHLGHGGLRYLPHLEWGLVREARRELRYLLTIMPHLVRPLSMVLPVYKGDAHPYLLIKCGLILYDWFSGKSTLPHHQSLYIEDLLGNSQKGIPGKVPGLRNQGDLIGGFQYYDTQIVYPERLCIENLRDALEQHSERQPVQTLSHTKVTRIDEYLDYVHITFQDQLALKPRSYPVKAKYVVNATGHSVDKLLQVTHSPYNVKVPQMGPTKGTHIMIHNVLGLKHTIYTAAVDGRPFFVIPYPIPDHETTVSPYLLIGTTDDKQWESEYPTSQEIEYLLQSTQQNFPETDLSESDIFWAYSGFRPLPASKKQAGSVTRKHIIRHVGNSRIFHVIGGKLTTYRSLAEEVSDKVIAALKQEPHWDFLSRIKHAGHCITAQRPLPGGRGINDIFAFKDQEIPKAVEQYDISPEIVAELINRYGACYTEVVDLTFPCPADPQCGPHLKTLLPQQAGNPPIIEAQVLHSLRYEGAETIMDVMTESLKMDLLPGSGLEALDVVASLVNSEKSFSSEREKTQQIQAYRDFIHHNLQWQQTTNS